MNRSWRSSLSFLPPASISIRIYTLLQTAGHRERIRKQSEIERDGSYLRSITLSPGVRLRHQPSRKRTARALQCVTLFSVMSQRFAPRELTGHSQAFCSHPLRLIFPHRTHFGRPGFQNSRCTARAIRRESHRLYPPRLQIYRLGLTRRALLQWNSSGQTPEQRICIHGGAGRGCYHLRIAQDVLRKRQNVRRCGPQKKTSEPGLRRRRAKPTTSNGPPGLWRR